MALQDIFRYIFGNLLSDYESRPKLIPVYEDMSDREYEAEKRKNIQAGYPVSVVRGVLLGDKAYTWNGYYYIYPNMVQDIMEQLRTGPFVMFSIAEDLRTNETVIEMYQMTQDRAISKAVTDMFLSHPFIRRWIYEKNAIPDVVSGKWPGF